MKLEPKDRLLITQTLEELSGLAFKGGGWTPKERWMYADRYARIFAFLPKIAPENSLLETGLCRGVMALLLKRVFSLKKIFAIEHPLTCKKYAKVFLSKMKSEGVVLRPCDLHSNDLPFAENHFDLVVMSEVLEHLVPATGQRTIRQIWRVVKPGKLLFLSTPNIASLLKRLNLLRGRNPVALDTRLHQDATYGHIREYTIKEVVHLLKISGFTLENQTYASFDTQRSQFTRLEGFLTHIFPQLGNTMLFLAAKNMT